MLLYGAGGFWFDALGWFMWSCRGALVLWHFSWCLVVVNLHLV